MLFIFILSELQAFGEESANPTSSDFSIWIPKKMIIGQDYEGIIILDKPSNQENIFFLSTSDKSTLVVPLTTTISPLSNHGLFKIKALGEGNATVFGALDGNLVQSSTMVYVSNSKPSSLKIIIPTSTTKAESMQCYIFSEDKFGLPEPVDADAEISVTSSSMISVPQTISIQKGQYYTILPITTKGSGTISVSADNLGVTTINITKVADPITVKFAIAPDIANTNSLAYFYIWLEKDGKPYEPPYTIHASLSSSNTDVARFGNNYDITHFSDILYSTALRNGIAKGFVYTRNPGNTTISASVDGFGTTSAHLVVGPSINDQATGRNVTDYCDQFSRCNPNMVKTWVYPTIIDGPGYGIVGLYREINQSNSRVIIPIKADSSILGLSSNGSNVNYNKLIQMIPTRIPGSNEETGVTQAIEFPIQSDESGNFTLTASGPGESPSTANFAVHSRYSDSYHIKITPLPIKAGVNQDLSMIYITDSSGAMIDPSNIFNYQPTMVIQSSIQQVPKTLDFTMTDTILSGTVNKKSDIAVSIQGLGSSIISVEPFDLATNMEFELPPRVHVGEKFPYVVYKTDAYGIPLERIIPTDVSTSEVNFEPSGYMSVNKDGNVTVTILSENGAIMQSMHSFYNEMKLDTSVNNTIFKVGKENIFNIQSDIDNVIYEIQSIFPIVEKSSGKYSIMPTSEQNFDVTIFAHKDGFRPISETLHLVSKKILDMTVIAKGNDGTQLDIMPTVIINNQTVMKNTPFITTINAGVVKLEFPSSMILQNKNYVFNMTEKGSQKYDTNTIQTYLDVDSTIIAHYDLMLSINATDALGGGFYPYGKVVTLSAPEKWQASFLIRQVFDHWDGNSLPFDSKTNNVSFVAKENVSTSAVYRSDYAYLMLLVACLMTGMFAMKKRKDISWHLIEIRSKFDRFVPKKKIKTV